MFNSQALSYDVSVIVYTNSVLFQNVQQTPNTCVAHAPPPTFKPPNCEYTDNTLPKPIKYRGLGREYNFVPFGVETLGPRGPSAQNLFAGIAKRLVDVTGDRRAGGFLTQRISIAIQRGNAASILGNPSRVFLGLT
jgi:hypothetical protein